MAVRHDMSLVPDWQTLGRLRTSAAGEKANDAARRPSDPPGGPANGRSWVGSGMSALNVDDPQHCPSVISQSLSMSSTV